MFSIAASIVSRRYCRRRTMNRASNGSMLMVVACVFLLHGRSVANCADVLVISANFRRLLRHDFTLIFYATSTSLSFGPQKISVRMGGMTDHLRMTCYAHFYTDFWPWERTLLSSCG